MENEIKEILDKRLDEICSTLDEIREILNSISLSLVEIAKK